ncbi:LamB/YcsF family protein [Treponema berlinense]|uniref:LamB/YcsF family protein n=1 Tax=Treponema berlinense TaxID=225004 RepID=UPI002A81CE1C|nr:LamB/YcsF family protein [Treponema berlinense]MDY3707498.1 LamB/YcsF family protein [Treponema berlinense]
MKNVSPLELKAMVQYQIGALHSICVHGDSPKALEFVKKIRSSLETEGIKVVAMGK